jgi:hypothetical protein
VNKDSVFICFQDTVVNKDSVFICFQDTVVSTEEKHKDRNVRLVRGRQSLKWEGQHVRQEI